jgi:hypothetical protein
MHEPRSPDRTAPAANADILGEEARNEGKMEGLSEDLGQDGTPRDRGQAQPGKDINQAGFLKDEGRHDKPRG